MTSATPPDGLTQYPYDRPRLDIDPRYRWLCHNAPVFGIPQPGGGHEWLVTGWEFAREVLADQDLFSRALATGRGPSVRPEEFIIDLDGAAHSRLRRLAQQPFTKRRIEQLRRRATIVTDDLLDQMTAGGEPADLVTDLALPLPITMIGELLGVPAAEADRFVAWSEVFLATTAHTQEQALEAMLALADYIRELIAARQADPTGDLLSALVHARDNGDQLSETELVNLVVVLLVAGYETTATAITNITFTLLTDGHLLDQFRRTDDLPTAIEELLRRVPIGGIDLQARVATREVKLGGCVIQAGETVRVAHETANRDPLRFPDPDRIDLTRRDNPHLMFGHGPHMCLGANLARMELQVAFEALLTRFPRLRLAVPEPDIDWKEGLSVRGPRALPVAWS